jgi:uncharacterized membrane protein
MAKFFNNLGAVMGASFILLLILMVGAHHDQFDANYAKPFFLFLHVVSGITWIGLNFTQTPAMPKGSADLPPGMVKFLVPQALWFRYSALSTVVNGLIVAWISQYLVEALTFQPGFRVIGLGMWVALIMAFHVWFVIWPSQKKVLGIVEADADTRVKAATRAMIFSRANTMLSMPMLYLMITQRYLPR